VTMLPPDPDPRTPDGWDDLWDPRAREWVERPAPPPRPRSPLIPLFLAAVAGAVMASLVWAAVTHGATMNAEGPTPGTVRIDSPLAEGSHPAAMSPSSVVAVPSGEADGLSSVGPSSRPTPRPTAVPVARGHVIRGSASYCAPTPKYCQSWGGKVRLAAVPTFHYGDRRYVIRVCRQDNPSRCVTATVVSYCACGSHVVDLSPYAFTRLQPLYRGTVRVTVTW
jgi:hypothetical protein